MEGRRIVVSSRQAWVICYYFEEEKGEEERKEMGEMKSGTASMESIYTALQLQLGSPMPASVVA